MTVSYSDRFWKLLWRWKGSLWKTIWKDLLAFLLIYYIVRVIYRHGLTKPQMETFEKLVIMFNDFSERIPLTFLLGFYVGMVLTRWWSQFQQLSWPDDFLYCVSAFIRGKDQPSVQVRRTIARYLILSTILGWRSVSPRVFKRFPTFDHLVEYQLLTDKEKEQLALVMVKQDTHQQWFAPLNWAITLITTCYDAKIIATVNEFVQLMTEMQRFRNGFTSLFVYDWVSIPLVYTHVAVVVTYGYFALCVVGRQFIDPSREVKGHAVDMYLPFFTIIQFLFYMGWMKVGEDLMNPLGEDDEDFELNYLIDRHMEMAFLIVDTLHGQLPELPPNHMSSLQSLPSISNPQRKGSRARDTGPTPKAYRKLSDKDMLIVYPSSDTIDTAIESCSIDIRTNCMSVVSVTSGSHQDVSRKHSVSPRKY